MIIKKTEKMDFYKGTISSEYDRSAAYKISQWLWYHAKHLRIPKSDKILASRREVSVKSYLGQKSYSKLVAALEMNAKFLKRISANKLLILQWKATKPKNINKHELALKEKQTDTKLDG